MTKTRTLAKIYLKIAFEKPIFLRALYVALVVGIILNLINQGDIVFSMDFESFNYQKFGLTFLVPYMVSTYSSAMSKIKFQVGEVSQFDAQIQCKGCGKTTKVSKGDIIKPCKNCGDKTKWRLINK